MAVHLVKTSQPDLNISEKDLATLFNLTQFLFKGNLYDQTDGVAMISPLGPIFTNLFMGNYEKNG